MAQRCRGWFRIAAKLALIVPCLSGSLTTRAEAQGAGEIARDQTAIIEQFEGPPRARPRIPITLSAPVAGLPDARLKSVRFRLRSIVLEGARTLDPALFAPLWEGLIGRQISLLDLKKVVEGIERIYRENDYYGAAAVPQQDFASGRIRIILYDSYIRDVVVKSERPVSSKGWARISLAWRQCGRYASPASSGICCSSPTSPA